MKNTKFLSNMTVFTLSCLIFACNPTVEPTPDVNTFVKSDLIKTYELGIEGQNYALVGDTTLPKQETTLHPTPSKPNLNSISTNANFKYVAIGASLTAGVRDGGWTNDGMMTSYPNLIARQMGITDFKQPYFNEKEFNGYGLKLQTSNNETPVPRYKAVSNNLAFKPSGVEMILTPYEGSELNNFAVPNLIDDFYTNLSNNDVANTYYKLQLKRILGQSIKSIENQIILSDLVSIESYQQGLIKYALTGNGQYLPQISYLTVGAGNGGYYDINEQSYTGGTDLILYKLYKKDIKNFVLFNTPNVLNFPFFKTNCISFSKIKAVFDKYQLTNRDYGYDINDEYKYFPSPSMDTLFKYQNDKDKFLEYYLRKLQTKVLLKNDEKRILDLQYSYNNHIKFLSIKYNTAVVDINSVYEKVSNGTYVTDDGRKVTDKDFFSSDGLYPTAYGQAIIANECIRTINVFYKTNIPLIKTFFYLK